MVILLVAVLERRLAVIQDTLPAQIARRDRFWVLVLRVWIELHME